MSKIKRTFQNRTSIPNGKGKDVIVALIVWLAEKVSIPNGKGKDEWDCFYRVEFGVSIPNGKGKVEEVCHQYLRRSQVSIPNGKGKDDEDGTIMKYNEVSIPYGKGKVKCFGNKCFKTVCINSLWERLRYCPRAQAIG